MNSLRPFNPAMSGLRRAVMAMIVLAPFLAGVGCGTFALNPITSETRPIYAIQDAALTVTVMRTLSFDDSKSRVYNVTLPQGVYKLEAQDADYWYFAAPTLLSRATYDGKEVADRNLFCGGLMLAKKPGMLVPAGIYRSDGSMNMTLIWRFSSDFMKTEGTAWQRSEKR
jgi:hypothetical protein